MSGGLARMLPTVTLSDQAFASRHRMLTIILWLHVPLLVIHGDADEIVPFSQGEAIFDAANRPKYFWRVLGANHNNLLHTAGPAYEKRLREFYESAFQMHIHAASR